jgi:hypothetical protein
MKDINFTPVLHGNEAVVNKEQARVWAYQAAFDTERVQTYPVVDEFEHEMGYALDRVKMEDAARVLACPLKVNPPNWQHGRVLYALARDYFKSVVDSGGWFQIVDIGTAKGFSALCLQWALDDSGKVGQVVSMDVIDPAGTEKRNTVAECSGPVTLADIHAPWPDAKKISFIQSDSLSWLRRLSDRIHVAFVDGKHDGSVVSQEARLISSRQVSGDVVVFDDAQIPGVDLAIRNVSDIYTLRKLTVKDNRAYVIGRRR